MEQFQNITIVKEANIYLDSKVTSRTVLFEDGTRETLGIVLPGQYELGIGDSELMEILAGIVRVPLPGRAEWQTIEVRQSSEIPAGSKSQIEMQESVDYYCSYGKE